MELYVNPQITGFRQDVDGTIKELKIGSNKEDAYENIIEQGTSAKLDKNKTSTINVSTYTETVEITPTSGKDGMKKATVTLSNIPSASAYLFHQEGTSFSLVLGVGTFGDITVGTKGYLCSSATEILVEVECTAKDESGATFKESAESDDYSLSSTATGTALSFE